MAQNLRVICVCPFVESNNFASPAFHSNAKKSKKRAADAILEHRRDLQSSPVDSLYSIESFRSTFYKIGIPGHTLSDVDLQVLIRYLARDRGCLVVDKEVVKFVEASSNSQITAVDHGMLELKTAVSQTSAQIDSLQGKIDERTRSARLALRDGRKERATAELRLRKQLEDSLRKRLGALETLQGTLTAIEGAAGDLALMTTYESSTNTLRELLSHPSLQRERIDATMEAMADAVADQREIQEAMRPTLNEEIDEHELEKELAELVQESEREKVDKLAAPGRAPSTVPEHGAEGESESQQVDSRPLLQSA